MKKAKLNSKLNLKKETLSNLNSKEVKGGTKSTSGCTWCPTRPEMTCGEVTYGTCGTVTCA